MPGLAVVTGASSGIGEAYAERLAADGWDLLVVARSGERLRELATRLNQAHRVTVRVVQADLSDAGEVERVGGEIGAMPVDMLVNNAGLAYYMPFADLVAAKAAELVDLNVLAPVLLTQAVLPGMLDRSRGTIINVASLLAFTAPWRSRFCPSGWCTRPPSRSWSPSARRWRLR